MKPALALIALVTTFGISTLARAEESCPDGKRKIDMTNPACVSTVADVGAKYDKAYALILEQAKKSTEKNVKYLRELYAMFGPLDFQAIKTFKGAAAAIMKRTDLSADDKAKSISTMKSNILRGLYQKYTKIDKSHTEVSGCRLFDSSTTNGCAMHYTGDSPQTATPGFARDFLGYSDDPSKITFTACAFKRLDEPDGVDANWLFNDARTWYDGNDLESEPSLHYLPVSVCSTLDLSGDKDYITYGTPEKALKHPATDDMIARHRFGTHRSNISARFYQASRDEAIQVNLEPFCLKPCVQPVKAAAEPAAPKTLVESNVLDSASSTDGGTAKSVQ